MSLLSVYGRRPRVVMMSALQLDPSLDELGNRLPHVFIQHSKIGESLFTEQIQRLARGLDHTGALVIFPEGANWTPGQWRRGIRRLERSGRPDLASRARDMPNLLPPRPGGTLAAIEACLDADVIFVAHSGLDNIVSVGDVAGLPDRPGHQGPVVAVPHDAVPRDATHDAQVKWRCDRWKQTDSWISENRPGGATGLQCCPASTTSSAGTTAVRAVRVPRADHPARPRRGSRTDGQAAYFCTRKPTLGSAATTCLAALPRTARYAFKIVGRSEVSARASVTESRASDTSSPRLTR